VQEPAADRDESTRGVPPKDRVRLLELARVVRGPIARFLRVEAASGIVLLVAAAVALFWANVGPPGSHARFWEAPIELPFGSIVFGRSLEWLVNDGLMTVFFFVAGLEIRREARDGALSSWRRAALPLVAGLGGMMAPACVYLLMSGAGPTRVGWGVPMATDIAFAIGILALLGKRVPTSLRVLLLTLAVLDDLGAIIVIAFFYSRHLEPWGLVVAVLGLAGVALSQRLRGGTRLPYLVAAAVAWAGVQSAGVHPAIAGVGIGLVTGRDPTPGSDDLVERLHPWVAYGVMPSFALANAGVALSHGTLDAQSVQTAIAVATGLVVGKPLGILAASLLALRLRLVVLPDGLDARHLVVLGTVAGIGFTMAIFIAQLAFVGTPLLDAAKVGVLVASALSGILGLLLGGVLLRR